MSCMLSAKSSECCISPSPALSILGYSLVLLCPPPASCSHMKGRKKSQNRAFFSKYKLDLGPILVIVKFLFLYFVLRRWLWPVWKLYTQSVAMTTRWSQSIVALFHFNEWQSSFSKPCLGMVLAFDLFRKTKTWSFAFLSYNDEKLFMQIQ